MKRKLALLLATVMTLSMLPVNVFGTWHTSYVDLSRRLGYVPRESLIVEQGILGGHPIHGHTGFGGNDDISAWVDGNDLVIRSVGVVHAGNRFAVELQNATWFFRSDTDPRLTQHLNLGLPYLSSFFNPTAVDVTTIPSPIGSIVIPANTVPTTTALGTLFPQGIREFRARYATPAAGLARFNSLERWARAANGQYNTRGTPFNWPNHGTTYHVGRGVWLPDTTLGITGYYYRFGTFIGGHNYAGYIWGDGLLLHPGPFHQGAPAEIPYRMRVGLDWRATFEVLPRHLRGRVVHGVHGVHAVGTNRIPARYTNFDDWGNQLFADMVAIGATFNPYLMRWINAYNFGWGDLLTHVTPGSLFAINYLGDYYPWNPNPLHDAIYSMVYDYTTDRLSAIPHAGAMRSEWALDMFLQRIAEETEFGYIQMIRDLFFGTQAFNFPQLGYQPIGYQTVHTHFGGPGETWEIRVPLVILTNDDAAPVRVRVTETTGAIPTSGWIEIAAEAGRITDTWVYEPEVARTDFIIDRLIIDELRPNSIRPGVFRITAPTGFEFTLDSITNAVVNVDAGLTWAATSGALADRGPGARATAAQRTRIANTHDVASIGSVANYYLRFRTFDDATHPRYRERFDEDRSIIYVYIDNFNTTTHGITGIMYITGLRFIADENAPFGDVMFNIQNAHRNLGPDWVGTLRAGNPGVSNQNFVAGIRSDWTINLRTVGTIPELINGRFWQDNPLFADDATHRTANVIFEENASEAWWAGRETIFELSEGAAFRRVVISDTDYVEWVHPFENQHFVSYDGRRVGHVALNGRTMTWTDLRVDRQGLLERRNRASVTMHIWVSLESGKVGDVTLTVGGSGIPEQPGAVPPVVIARQISPVTVETVATDQRIGYQFQRTSDIIITENVAGALQHNRTVYISVSDLVADDVLFSPDAVIQVTNGDMQITSLGARGLRAGWGTGTGWQTFLGLSGGTLTFRVDRASTVPSTITISNVSVRVDRTVPETNLRPYQVIVWGEAIAPNYHFFNWNPEIGFRLDKFPTPGIMVDYLNIVTPAVGPGGVLMQEVRVGIGESFITVNGVPHDVDAPAYISPVSNSTMIPIRAIAVALGIPDHSVLWDQANRAVSIILPTRVVQFQVDSSTKIINGVEITMFSPDGLEVNMEQQPVSPWRTFVPFRALGYAFGIEVAWDEATQTAIFNPGAGGAAN